MDNKINVTIHGVGDISKQLNQMRADRLLHNLHVQDINPEKALDEHNNVRSF